MNKKLIAVAVAGAFALPGAAMAQVTVSGKMGIQLSNIKIGDALPARAGLNKSETFVNDNATIIRIGAREDLGGGMEAFGQYEFRPVMDGNSTGPAGSMQAGSPTGVSFIGMRSNAWGSVRAGTDITWSSSGEIKSASSSQHFSSSPINSYLVVGGTVVSFASSRSRNMIIYDTPDFKNGFKFTGMWSASAANDEGDLTNGQRKGQNFFLFPEFSAGNWKVGYSYMKMKFDASPGVPAVIAATPAGILLDLDGHKIYGDMSFGGGFDANISFAKHKGKNAVTGANVADVRKTIISGRFTTGNNVFAAMYGRSGDDRVQAGDQKYTLTGLTYNYNFSRRTNMGITWMRMKNEPGASADITSTTTASYATANASANLGEDQTLISLSLNHNF